MGRATGVVREEGARGAGGERQSGSGREGHCSARGGWRENACAQGRTRAVDPPDSGRKWPAAGSRQPRSLSRPHARRRAPAGRGTKVPTASASRAPGFRHCGGSRSVTRRSPVSGSASLPFRPFPALPSFLGCQTLARDRGGDLRPQARGKRLWVVSLQEGTPTPPAAFPLSMDIDHWFLPRTYRSPVWRDYTACPIPHNRLPFY